VPENSATKFDWSIFSHPRVLFAEQVLATGVQQIIQNDSLRTGRDMLVDYIHLSGEDYSTGVAAPGACFNNIIFANWWIQDRSRYYIQPVELIAIDNAPGSELGLVAAAWDAGVAVYSILYHHPVRWVYNPVQNVIVEWVNPASLGLATNASNVNMELQGVGLVTGHRRLFHIVIPIAANAAGQVQGVVSNQQTMANAGDQPYLIEHTRFWFTTNAPLGMTEPRHLKHIRVRVRPTQGDAWSDTTVPLAFYGVERRYDNSMHCIFKPSGGPVLLRKGQQMVVEMLQNTGANVNLQVCLFGRCAPGYRAVQ